jgi:hypothetical protein
MKISHLARTVILFLFFGLGGNSVANAQLSTGWKAHDLSRPRPAEVTPGESNLPLKPPSDAIVLFDGTDLSSWVDGDGKSSKWKIVDGAMESVAGAGYIFTKEAFGDCQLHIEWATPSKVEGNGQGRGNSGVFLMGKYEIQVLDSYQNDTYADGSAGAIYGQYPPLVNVSRPPGEWQSYDIIFRKPRFDEQGELVAPATLTVLHNGVLIQDHESILGPTDWIFHREYDPSLAEGPLGLQDHGNPVRFRNIWIRPLEAQRPKPEQPYRSESSPIEMTEEELKRFEGDYRSFSVGWHDGSLFLRHLGRQLEMVPVSDIEFEFRKSAGRISFEFDENGNVLRASGVVDAAGRFGGTKGG